MRMKSLGGLILLLISTSALASQSKNLLANLAFDQGKSTFLTGYFKTSTGIVYEDHYAIGSNANEFNPEWSSTIQPHSGGSMMIVNGATQPDVIVWQSGRIRVKPHTTYFFGAYATSLYGVSPPILVFRINGTQSGAEFHPSQAVGKWTQFNTIWNSGTATHASISIVDGNTDEYGNDFALAGRCKTLAFPSID
jgi:hypothetical protein